MRKLPETQRPPAGLRRGGEFHQNGEDIPTLHLWIALLAVLALILDTVVAVGRAVA